MEIISFFLFQFYRFHKTSARGIAHRQQKERKDESGISMRLFESWTESNDNVSCILCLFLVTDNPVGNSVNSVFNTEDLKVLTGCYNGGLWENILERIHK